MAVVSYWGIACNSYNLYYKLEEVIMKKENHAIIITSILAGTIIILALLALFVFIPMFSSTNTMTVDGTSTIKVLPDIVAVSFNIQTNGTNSSAANDANN